MPYLYSAFYDSHARGCPVARPLFFVFPADTTTLLLREQWMMGAPYGAAATNTKPSPASDRSCMGSSVSARLLSGVSGNTTSLTGRFCSSLCAP